MCARRLLRYCTERSFITIEHDERHRHDKNDGYEGILGAILGLWATHCTQDCPGMQVAT